MFLQTIVRKKLTILYKLVLYFRFEKMRHTRQLGKAVFKENFKFITLLGYGYHIASLTEPIMSLHSLFGYKRGWKYANGKLSNKKKTFDWPVFCFVDESNLTYSHS